MVPFTHAVFSSRIPDKNRVIKRGLERKNRAIKKSRYVCQGTNVLNIAGNPIKDINVNLSFLSSGSKVAKGVE